MLYSKITGGFYLEAVHGTNIPTDVIEITQKDYDALILSQSEGNTIIADAEGKPIIQLVEAPTQPVITSVTMRQARLALLQAGLLSVVQAALQSIPDDMQRQSALIEWEFAATVDKGSPWVANLTSALGLTSEALDGLFLAASKL